MTKQKGPAGAVGKGGVSPAPQAQDMTVRVAAEQLMLMPLEDLVPYANNARRHSKAQIAQLRASLREFGFVTPVLIDFDNNIIMRRRNARRQNMPLRNVRPPRVRRQLYGNCLPVSGRP